MLGQEFMRNALLAGTFVALACGVCGWFVVLRAQVFAGDALSHVAFPGALAAAAAEIDERVGLFAATVLVGAGIGLLGLGGASSHRGMGHARAAGGSAAQDTAIGIVFTFVLGLGVFFLTLFSMSASGGAGIQAAHTLFGSIYGLGGGEARVAAAVALGATVCTLAISRPLLFVSLTPDIAAAKGVPARALSVGFLALLGVVAAGATQAVGALLLLGLLTGPAAAAHRLTGRPYAGIALAGLLGVGAMWGGLGLELRRAAAASEHGDRDAGGGRVRDRGDRRRVDAPPAARLRCRWRDLTLGAGATAITIRERGCDGGYHRDMTANASTGAWTERAEATLAAAGHRRGGARRALLELLDRQECALTAQEIEDALRSRGGGGRVVSRASVYRILDELERLRLVQRVETGQAMVRYERVCERKEHHHHLVCDECGVVMPFFDVGLERAIETLSERVPLAVSEHEIVLHGSCRDCAA